MEKMKQELHDYRGLIHLERGWACPQPFPYTELNVVLCILTRQNYTIQPHCKEHYLEGLNPVATEILAASQNCASHSSFSLKVSLCINTTHSAVQEQGSGHGGIPSLARSLKQMPKSVGEL